MQLMSSFCPGLWHADDTHHSIHSKGTHGAKFQDLALNDTNSQCACLGLPCAGTRYFPHLQSPFLSPPDELTLPGPSQVSFKHPLPCKHCSRSPSSVLLGTQNMVPLGFVPGITTIDYAPF